MSVSDVVLKFNSGVAVANILLNLRDAELLANMVVAGFPSDGSECFVVFDISISILLYVP